MKLRFTATALATVLLAMAAATAQAQVDARMFRQPAVSQTQIAFVYAGDIWVVPKKGGTADAAQLAARRGIVPAVFARRHARSPTARRTTATRTSTSCPRPAASRCGSRIIRWPIASIGWHPDGKRVLFASAARAAGSASTSSISSASTAGCPRSCRCPTASSARSRRRRHGLRLHADVAGLPHVEALSRRLGARPVALRSEDVRLAQHHQQPGQRRAADVARQHHLLPLGSRRRASATTSGRYDVGLGASRGRSRSSTDFDITFPSIGRGLDRVPGRRPLVPARPVDARRRPRCRSASSPTRRRCGRARRRPRRSISDASVSPTGQARRVRGARRRRHGAGGERRGHQRDALVRRRRALPALVARRQDDRLLERSQRRVRADAARRRRIGRRAEGDVRSGPDSATRRTGRPTARSWRSSIRR